MPYLYGIHNILTFMPLEKKMVIIKKKNTVFEEIVAKNFPFGVTAAEITDSSS